ncbi:MAG: tetratricopeptide repeat protein, partial [Thermoplasmata archaeon]|nr:tetratricopeptide repeat protein [Thermoplasmata archaeon]NIS13836.1 tetratricopeptide repeat protein [Thermoplasmata archaeon]NIS21682.1 tetratricopeptide repeat protein [Thermoplasmata archaeon]NIT79278.1 tetratricopeptide repeat protein [Thermoplasmata archaeon]NIU50714.1 tetratricopeptide repeat protein [Thermoplasmata archaeon]
IELDIDYKEAYKNRGNALLSLFRIEEAEAAYREALALDEEDSEVWDLLGACLLQEGRLDEAMEAIDHAISLDNEVP